MKLKKWMLAVVCVALLTGSLKVQAEETVKPSNVNYKISFQNASNIFIGNEKKVDWKPGDLYFLTYTVRVDLSRRQIRRRQSHTRRAVCSMYRIVSSAKKDIPTSSDLK